MKYAICFFAVLFCSINLFGQKNISLSGILLEENTEIPIDLANIRLLNTKDSTLVSGAFSNSKGAFSLKNLSKGNYILHASFLGYNDYYKNIELKGNNTNVNAGTIFLSPNAYLLEEAVIVGKAAEIVVKEDTIEYNADSFKTTENAVIEDLIKKLPGAEVDKDGKITINGKEVKKFLVEGKEFISDDPTVASKNLPAEMVNKLQVVDRKSDLARLTGFDDGEEETVINITVKEGMKQGTIGNALAGLGADTNNDNDLRYQAGAFLNHMRNNDRYTFMLNANNNNNMGAADLGASRFQGMRGMRRGSGGIIESQAMNLDLNKEFTPKLSLNGYVGYNSMDRDSETKKEVTTLAEKQSQLDKTSSKTTDISDNFSASFRLEWKPDSNNTIIFRPNFGYNKSSSDQEEILGRFDYYSLDTLYTSNSLSYNEGEGYNLGASLDYAYKFSKPGRVISANVRGSYNDSYSSQDLNTLYRNFNNGIHDNDSIVNQRIEGDDISKSFRIYTSYVEPLGKNYFLQIAYRLSLSKSESLNSTYDIFENDLLAAASYDTASINARQSRSNTRNSTEQRFSLNIKSMREKYNYTIGLNIDPSSSVNKTYQPYHDDIGTELVSRPIENRLPNVMGDSLISDISQDVINLSPVINFIYNFEKRTNLRIDYEGETNQPSVRQLREYIDESNPKNPVQGNPNLKPGYTNSLRARFQKFMPESQIFYNINLRGNLSFNDVSSVTTMQEGGIKFTTYENINGNWDANLSGMFNAPLKNKKFTIGAFSMVSYNNRKSFTDGLKNTMKNFSGTIRLQSNYRSDLFDVGINGNIRYSDITYEINPEENQRTYNWGAGAYTTWYLPYNFTFESDINWTDRSGYSSGFNISETIWNAAVTKRLFSKRIGTGSLKLQIYDILKNRNNISSSYTTNGYSTTESNAITSYFICSFIYKFSIFPGGSSATEGEMRDRGFRGPGGPGGRGGRPF